MVVPMTLEGLNNLKGYTVVGLLDSGATNRFMSQQFVDEHGIEVEPLAVAVPVYNAA
jgi:predicted aspartyl protease